MSRHLERADVLMQQSRYALAEEELRASLAEGVSYALCHALRGYCFLQIGKLDEAEAAVRQALEAEPAEPYAHYTRSLIACRRRKFDDARQAIGQAIELDPTKASYRGILGHILLNERRLDEALVTAEAGLVLDPTDEGCSTVRAFVLSALGRNQEASSDIEAQLVREPDEAGTHATQGWSLVLQGNAEEARGHFLEALRLNPEMDWARRGLLETMKAPLPLYALFLRYQLWSFKHDTARRWPVLLGLALILAALADIPALLFFAGMAATAFVMCLVFASAFYTCLLTFDSAARRIMTETECRASRAAIACLTIALLCAGYAYVSVEPLAWGGFVTLLIVAVVARIQLKPGASPRS